MIINATKSMRSRVARWLPCLTLILLGSSLCGCLVAAVGAAAGAGAYAYYQGNVSASYASEFGQTYQCTKAALTDLAMPVLSEHHDGLTGSIESSIEDGTHVTIKLEEKPRILATDSHQTEVTVRVGVLGDSKVSARLQDQIGQHVARNVPNAAGNRLPPLTNNQIVQPAQATAPPGVNNAEWKPATQSNQKVLPP